jgi:hypothetical protein
MSSDDARTGSASEESAKDKKESGQGEEASGGEGNSAARGGQGAPLVRSSTSENRQGHMNPSAPEDANVTPGSAGEK